MDNLVSQTILDLLLPIVKAINADCQIDFQKEADQYRIVINNGTQDLVGEKSEVIRSLQHLVRVVVHKKFPEDRTHFLFDVGGFRSKREMALKMHIPELANIQVLQEGQTVVLVNLSGYERLLVHQLLADIDGLDTNSVGPKNDRKLLIMPTSEVGSTAMDDAIIWDITAHSK